MSVDRIEMRGIPAGDDGSFVSNHKSIGISSAQESLEGFAR